MNIVILVGDMGVGKTSVLSKFIKGVMPESTLPTIAIEFATKEIKLKEGGLVKAQIWDTAGQEKYKAITSHHYRKALGALLIYDVTKRNTFDNCWGWYTEVKNYTEKSCVIALVGNKIDWISKNTNKREVSIGEAKEFAAKNKILFFETTAVESKTVSDCFEEWIQQIYNEQRKRIANDWTNSITINTKGNNNSTDNNNNDGCC